MKAWFIISVAAVGSLSFTFAAEQTPAPTQSPDAQFHIQQIDPNVDINKMAGPNVKLHTIDELTNKSGKLPPVEVRDAAIAHAGLTDDVKAWDELDKDILYLRARNFDCDRLKRSYPKLAPGKLSALQSEIKK